MESNYQSEERYFKAKKWRRSRDFTATWLLTLWSISGYWYSTRYFTGALVVLLP
jgi:hypothetical protein